MGKNNKIRDYNSNSQISTYFCLFPFKAVNSTVILPFTKQFNPTFACRSAHTLHVFPKFAASSKSIGGLKISNLLCPLFKIVKMRIKEKREAYSKSSDLKVSLSKISISNPWLKSSALVTGISNVSSLLIN
jgi:hypothetical protein